jgi:hypothetical protein
LGEARAVHQNRIPRFKGVRSNTLGITVPQGCVSNQAAYSDRVIRFAPFSDKNSALP